MTNKAITNKLISIFPRNEWRNYAPIKTKAYALVTYIPTNKKRRYSIPDWAVNYYGLARINAIYPKDGSGKICVRLESAFWFTVFIPHNKEILDILTYEEAHAKFPEYFI